VNSEALYFLQDAEMENLLLWRFSGCARSSFLPTKAVTVRRSDGKLGN